MLRIGSTCIVWYADLENAVETRIRAKFGIVFENSKSSDCRVKNSILCLCEFYAFGLKLDGFRLMC